MRQSTSATCQIRRPCELRDLEDTSANEVLGQTRLGNLRFLTTQPGGEMKSPCQSAGRLDFGAAKRDPVSEIPSTRPFAPTKPCADIRRNRRDV